MSNHEIIIEEFFIQMNNFRIQMHNFIKSIASDYDLTGQELIFLFAIDHFTNVTVSKLTCKLNVKQANVSKMVRTLEEQDLIIKQPDDSNLRSHNLSLTPKAQNMIRQIQNSFTQHYQATHTHIDFELMKQGMGEMMKLISIYEQ